MRMQGYCPVYKWTILKRTSPEVKCLHPTSSRREMCTSSVSNVIYHKFSHGAAFYTLNGKNVNVMLEFLLLNVNYNIHSHFSSNFIIFILFFQGISSMSDYAIGFHYVNPSIIYLLEYFIYHLRPYGIQFIEQDLNKPAT